MADLSRRCRPRPPSPRCRRIDHRARPARDRPRHRREPGQPERLRPVQPAHRGRLQGRGQACRHLFIGDKTPTGGNLFAKRNDEKRVFLIAAFQESSLNRSTFDLRDKTLIKFERDKVDGVDITAGGKTMALAKEGGEWQITNPINARADFGASEGLIGRVQTAQMKSIVADNARTGRSQEIRARQAGDHRPVNLGSSKRRPRVRRQGGRQHRLRARRVEAVGRHGRERARRRLEEGRRRLPAPGRLRVPAFNANRAEITWAGKTLALERVKGEGDKPDTWKRSGAGAGDADKAKVETLLTGLADT